MVKIDLITGFLGSGKTTFIKKYVRYREKLGESIGIIENDFGAINVDMMLIDSIQSDACIIEQVVGGSNREEWCRRFKSKLIAMSMRNLDRVIVEPSGIFEPEWFFDVLFTDDIAEKYSIDNCVALIDGSCELPKAGQAEYLIACQLAAAETVLVTKSEKFNEVEQIRYKTTIVELMRRYRINKPIFITFGEYQINEELFRGFCSDDIIKKHFSPEEKLETMFLTEVRKMSTDVERQIEKLFDEIYGVVLRVKGFIKSGGSWLQINATKNKYEVVKVEKGQEVLIIIGYNLNKEKIKNCL